MTFPNGIFMFSKKCVCYFVVFMIHFSVFQLRSLRILSERGSLKSQVLMVLSSETLNSKDFEILKARDRIGFSCFANTCSVSPVEIDQILIVQSIEPFCWFEVGFIFMIFFFWCFMIFYGIVFFLPKHTRCQDIFSTKATTKNPRCVAS